ncbi:aliphatic sulfonate ABC transporter substrate-binding protein [Pseudothauera rhizosphaerae]|uniref:Putative aliphatic sulfonates-binding protein n=1 Tax=Pseudothauera rhizosphaerae TaxID=2565932 RepID=A0A4S4AYK2_9RHOO|nr:aliphatic sulfonate ABC transporter substrate-binding protein [Pseudothauera rhizosphaerae]THF65217.1 aliphatic sulfonate ABC transporter substrate-binding protein [Pseudothauera rhizosphaerae]
MSKHTINPLRRKVLGAAVAAGAAGLALPLRSFAAGDEVLRIGFQKSSSLLIIQKGQGSLEKALAPLGVKVQWTEFSSGLPMLEGLNVGSIDLSADVAETVPLFAQAAKAQLTYFVQETPSPPAQAIVVPDESPIRSLADLKGRKVGFAKAAGVHYLTVKALEKAGLKFTDIEAAYLQPADGRAAFEKGAIDAWAIWDPHLANIQGKRKVRVIADGNDVGVAYRRFYLASTPYAKRRPDVLAVVAEELRKTGEWVKNNPREAAAIHAPLVGLDPATVSVVNGRRSYAVRPVDDVALDEQQVIADVFAREKLLPVRLDARANDVWKKSA